MTVEKSWLIDQPDMIEALFVQAIIKNASDIHIEPIENFYRIRFRIDGVLSLFAELPSEQALRLINRLKVLAQLDITEKRLPLDGRFQFKIDNQIYDCRISTCPTMLGEKVVIRILKDAGSIPDMEQLGLNSKQIHTFKNALNCQNGLILVTGPTGSGKTTTLYAALNYLNKITTNIVTIEDPVEIQLNGINQVAVNSKVGVHFSTALRSFMRQDPDIIMVGEIRDNETAETAIKAAETGHLILSTLHTNSAIESLIRLANMNIASIHLAYAIKLIIAQRLIRKLCTHCKIIKNGTFQAVGCNQCTHGYQGRIGAFELLQIDDDLRIQLLTQKSLHPHQPIQLPDSLEESILALVRSGVTSDDETKLHSSVNFHYY